MDSDLEEYIIEEIEYVDYAEEADGIEIDGTQTIEEKPSTSTDVSKATVTRNDGTMVEENLVEELIGGEITLSEYDKEGAETDSDAESVSDTDAERPSTSTAVSKSAPSLAHGIRRSPSASQSFENELDRSRKDAMRGLLQGRDELRDGRQRRRCVLPAALQGNAIVVFAFLFLLRN